MVTDKRKEGVGKRFKSFDVKEYRFDKESRTISGYAAIFNNVDKSDDMLMKGCFARSIIERGPESKANDKIIFLWMHNMSEPIGKITTLYEDAKGLYFEAVIDKIDLGDRALIQLESGTLNQFSFGYDYVWDKCEWVEVNGKYVFVVGEVVLYEISVVSIGCNGETEYTGLKTAEEFNKANNELQDEIEDVLKGLTISKKSEIKGLIAKTRSLAKFESVSEIKDNLPRPQEQQAAKGIDFFTGVKLKQKN